MSSFIFVLLFISIYISHSFLCLFTEYFPIVCFSFLNIPLHILSSVPLRSEKNILIYVCFLSASSFRSIYVYNSLSCTICFISMYPISIYLYLFISLSHSLVVGFCDAAAFPAGKRPPSNSSFSHTGKGIPCNSYI